MIRSPGVSLGLARNDEALDFAVLSLHSRTALLRQGMGTPMPYGIKGIFIH